MQDIVIFGTGGFAREVHQIVEDINAQEQVYNFLGFIDGNTDKHGSLVHGAPVLGGTDWLESNPNVGVNIAVGNTAAKKTIVAELQSLGHQNFVTLVHPLAWIGNRVEVGSGTTICAGTMITTDLKIGSHVIINLSCTVGHDSQIDDYVTVAPSVNISGNVRVSEGVDLGTGAKIIQGITIGHRSIIGAGSVVVRDIPANATAVGVPAKVIKEHT